MRGVRVLHLGAALAAFLLLPLAQAEEPPAPPLCTVDTECSDGAFCNGEERCIPNAADADARGCVRAAIPSPCEAGQTCNEESNSCAVACRNFDGDPFTAAECGGTDCDDDDPNRYPGNAEICDVTGHDEDCDTSTFAARRPAPMWLDDFIRIFDTDDQDGDGYVAQRCFNTDFYGVEARGADCDDTNRDVHPAEAELCNGVDDNCNGQVDEGLLVAMYPDADGDGYGDAGAVAMFMCSGTPGLATVSNDCNDGKAGIHPGQAELCNGVDDNCNGQVDEGLLVAMYPDADGDGYGRTGAAPSLVCGGSAGVVVTANDCDDADPAVFPGSSVCSDSTTVRYCAPNGQASSGTCDAATRSFCLTQPNGAGICVPSRPAPQAAR